MRIHVIPPKEIEIVDKGGILPTIRWMEPWTEPAVHKLIAIRIDQRIENGVDPLPLANRPIMSVGFKTSLDTDEEPPVMVGNDKIWGEAPPK